MEFSLYQQLLAKQKEMDIGRQQYDSKAFGFNQKADEIFEKSRAEALSKVDEEWEASRQTLRLKNHELWRAMKEKHAFEMDVLRKQQENESKMLKQEIHKKDRDLVEDFRQRRHEVSLELDEKYKAMLEKRSQDQLILEAARSREDNELKEQVFRAFKVEASTWSTLAERQPDLQQRLSINKQMEESESPANPIIAAEEREAAKDATEPSSAQATGNSESHHKAHRQQPRAGIILSRSKSAPHTPKQTSVEHNPVQTPFPRSEDNVKQKTPTKNTSYGHDQVKFASPPRGLSRQRQRKRSMQRMMAQGQSSVRPKVIFELKSFVCGAAVWRISSNLQLRFIRANQTFEIYHGGNSLSAMHPDWLIDGRAGQRSTCDTSQNTFELKRENSLTIKLEFTSSQELEEFLNEFKVYGMVTTVEKHGLSQSSLKEES